MMSLNTNRIFKKTCDMNLTSVSILTQAKEQLK